MAATRNALTRASAAGSSPRATVAFPTKRDMRPRAWGPDLDAHSSLASACGYLGSMTHPRRRPQVGSHRRRVLVVEDDDTFAEALTELLEADGRLEVVGRARDGREAIELAEALRPDVVLMDIGLPVIDGVEATREIRRKQPTMPVVAVTGSEYEERALEMRDAGAVDFVRKARLDPDLVESVVAAAHRRHRRQRRGGGRFPDRAIPGE